MNPTYDHSLVGSFALYADYVLCKQAGAFFNVSGGLLYKVSDPEFSNYSVYASPYRQWVYDSSVDGATIISGVNVGNHFVQRGQSGLKIDFLRGRVYLSGSVTVPTISGTYAAKEIPTHITSEDEDKLVLNTAFYNRREALIAKTGLGPNTFPTPSAFIKYYPGINLPFELGGPVNTKGEFRITILAEDKDAFYLDGALGTFRDKRYKYMTLLTPAELPFTYYGDLKSGTFNYETLISEAFTHDTCIYISETYTNKFAAESERITNKRLIGGFIDFLLEKRR
jgi:hypothetical protein